MPDTNNSDLVAHLGSVLLAVASNKIPVTSGLLWRELLLDTGIDNR